MLLVISSFTSPELGSAIIAFQEIANDLQLHFANKTFGKSVQELYIGLIIVSPEYEDFFKPKRDKYTKSKREHMKDGFKISVENAFEMEIKIPYDTILNSTPEQIMHIISQLIINSLHRLYSHRSKFDDFNIDSFIESINNFFLAKGLL